MGYFTLEEELVQSCWIKEYPDLPEEVSFLDGKWVELPSKEPLEFVIKCSEDYKLNHFFNDHIPVFSAAMVEQLRLAGADNFQTFPAVLINKETGEKCDNYFAVNVLGLIDAASDESVRNVIMGGDKDDGVPALVHYEKLIIDQSRVKGALMFRELQSPDVLIFDDKIKEFLKANRPEEGWQIRLRRVESAYGA